MHTATITQIDPEAVLIQDVTYYRTVLVLDETDERIRSGMNVDVDIVVNQKDDVLTVPMRFIRSDDTGSYVHIASEDGFTKQYITRGVEGDDGSVEIIEGVSEGQQIYSIYDDEDE
jgi:HlyD family secretion protein